MRIVKDRASGRSELLLAAWFLTLIDLPARLLLGGRTVLVNFVRATGDAAHAVRPTKFGQIFGAIIVCLEGLLEVYQVHGSLLNCHYYPLDAVLCQGNNRPSKSFVVRILRGIYC